MYYYDVMGISSVGTMHGYVKSRLAHFRGQKGQIESEEQICSQVSHHNGPPIVRVRKILAD